MLKIKGNVNLEELEKYGFISYGVIICTYPSEEKTTWVKIFNNNIKIEVSRDRILNISSDYVQTPTSSEIIDFLYELKQKGIVEVIGD